MVAHGGEGATAVAAQAPAGASSVGGASTAGETAHAQSSSEASTRHAVLLGAALSTDGGDDDENYDTSDDE